MIPFLVAVPSSIIEVRVVDCMWGSVWAGELGNDKAQTLRCELEVGHVDSQSLRLLLLLRGEEGHAIVALAIDAKDIYEGSCGQDGVAVCICA